VSGFFSLADGRNVPVRDGLVIGRTAGCDLVLDDHKASRRHARVVVEAGVVEIEDLGSSNGTLLNGKAVTRRLLRDNDELQVGTTKLRYHEGARVDVPSPAAPARPAAAPTADGDELFGGETAVGAAPPPPVRAAKPAPAAPSPPSPPAPPPPSAPPPRPNVVEFADEVVEVRAPAPRAAAPGGGAPAGEPAVQRQQRVLQFSKQAPRGAFGEDLGQVGGPARALTVLAVLALAVGLAWLCAQLVS